MARPAGKDDYRVELWSDDESECLEVLARASDRLISTAAFHAAQTGRFWPVVLHFHGDVLLGRWRRQPEPGSFAVSPGYPLSDLPDWLYVSVTCLGCRRDELLDHAKLARSLGAKATIEDLRRRLRCRECGTRGAHWIETSRTPR